MATRSKKQLLYSFPQLLVRAPFTNFQSQTLNNKLWLPNVSRILTTIPSTWYKFSQPFKKKMSKYKPSLGSCCRTSAEGPVSFSPGVNVVFSSSVRLHASSEKVRFRFLNNSLQQTWTLLKVHFAAVQLPTHELWTLTLNPSCLPTELH